MNEINNGKTVKEQYASSSNLDTRISIHDKYSTNKQGFGNWIFSNYQIPEGARVLELGCGTASMWKGHEDIIGKCSSLILSDFSEAMVDTARGNLGEHDNVIYSVMDIQDIPYPDDSFDIVIANMMLYHVPDISRGLSEVSRVLAPGGKFYCATFGLHGIMEYLTSILADYEVKDPTSRNFTLQNGEEILSPFFDSVVRRDYKDSLAVTNVEDMVDYIYSLSSMTALGSIPRDKMTEILTSHMRDGVLHVPKEYGMFICT